MPLSPPPVGQRRVLAVPWRLETLPNLEAMREHMLVKLVESYRWRPHLVLMPAYTGVLVLSLFADLRFSLGPELRKTALKFGQAAEEILLDWSRDLAREMQVYLMPGTCLVPGEDGRLRHTAYLFDPDGRLLGKQEQTHVRAFDAELGIAGGEILRVWDVGGLRVGIAVGQDAWYPEVGRILALQGATVLLCPTAVPRPYPIWRQLAGSWQQAQGNQCFVIEVCPTGRFAGAHWQGRTAAFAPLEITAAGDGFLGAVSAQDEEDPLVVDLDVRMLVRVRREVPVARTFHTELYARSFPNLYLQRLPEADPAARGRDRLGGEAR